MQQQRRRVAQAATAALAAGERAVLATVVSSTGSAPRGLGAQLLFRESGAWDGALSGGCTEGAVIDEARALLAAGPVDGRTATLITYGKNTLGGVGPTCGAVLAVLVEDIDSDYAAALSDVAERLVRPEPARLTVEWTLEDGLDLSVPEQRSAGRRESVRAESAPQGARDQQSFEMLAGSAIHVCELAPAATLVLGGGGDIAVALVRLAGALGWRSMLLDPRATTLDHTLAACEPDVAAAVWADADAVPVPDGAAYVALAHESHIDDAFLTWALGNRPAYVGAIGSRRVHAERTERLAAAVGAEAAASVRGPAGLDLGGSTAEEIALSVLAEATAVLHERGGRPLIATSGPVRAR